MSIIYEPKGPAREYGELALNLFNGCSHGCEYCYVLSFTHTTREKFAHPAPRKIDWDKLEKELPAIAGKTVFLSFLCDPYQPLEEEAKVTRRTIGLLHAHNVGVKILTKAGVRSMRDFDLLAARPDLSSYGVTLTFTNVYDEMVWEPGAGSRKSRMLALEEAHRLGIPTWVSMEPVISPKQSLDLIEMAAPFTDTFAVGRWNHDTRANEIDWTSFTVKAMGLLKSLGKAYYIKQGLRESCRFSSK
jgi:DNA repair photolyase